MTLQGSQAVRRSPVTREIAGSIPAPAAKPRKARRCRYCGAKRPEHLGDGRCADGSGRTYSLTVKGSNTAGNSFNDRQVAAVEQLFRLADSEPGMRVLLRSPEITLVRRKFMHMRETIKRQLAAEGA